jgi:hypothetical protein
MSKIKSHKILSEVDTVIDEVRMKNQAERYTSNMKLKGDGQANLSRVGEEQF